VLLQWCLRGLQTFQSAFFEAIRSLVHDADFASAIGVRSRTWSTSLRRQTRCGRYDTGASLATYCNHLPH